MLRSMLEIPLAFVDVSARGMVLRATASSPSILPGGFERKPEGNDSDGSGSERKDIRTREKRLRTQEQQTRIGTAIITLKSIMKVN
ncbi:hypothetical protein TNCV_1751201 [Trichonephila clavipes]|nr:hypothetical protein TNCV_1751201 [Trichonephila clavipes]